MDAKPREWTAGKPCELCGGLVRCSRVGKDFVKAECQTCGSTAYIARSDKEMSDWYRM